MCIGRPDADVFTTLLADPAADIATLDQLYLRGIAAELASSACAGYARAGRGAVILGLYAVNLYSASGASMPISYLSHAQVSTMGVGGRAAELAQVIQDYAPEHEFVVCIDRAPRPSVYRVRHSSAQPLLHSRAPDPSLAKKEVSRWQWRSAWRWRDRNGSIPR